MIINESNMKELATNPVDYLVQDITKQLESALRGQKKSVYVKNGNTIYVKGNSLFNKAARVTINDTVEGMILRKYGDVKPNVSITVTYFKMGLGIAKTFHKKRAFSDVYDPIYSVGIGMGHNTSIKIKIKNSNKFKLIRRVKYITNREFTMEREKLSEEYELDYLLEKSLEVKASINKALHALKEWFNEKIKFIMERLTKLKNKALHIEHEEPERKSKIRTAFSKLKRTAMDIINDCKNGIRAASSKDATKAMEIKEKVSAKMIRFTEDKKTLGLVLGGATIAGGTVLVPKIAHELKSKHEYNLRQKLRNY